MKIERDLMKKFVLWKTSSRRQPMMLKGVRQCGKTWLLREFGKEHFASVAYFNFETDVRLASIFEGNLHPERIILQLGALINQTIRAQETLLIFDEIQLCPKALNSLKYFCEDAPQYAVAAAGSLLGVTLAAIPSAGFPVGKVDFFELTPCSFKEYLQAVAPMIVAYCAQSSIENIPEALTSEMETYLRQYLVVGGMPAALECFIESRDLAAVDSILEAIHISYQLDFSKHTSYADKQKLFLLWDSIPKQMGRGNERFFYTEVKKGARAQNLEDALFWLFQAGLVQKIENIVTPQLPLKVYSNRKIFKLYLSDTGLLRHLAQLSPSVVLNNQDLFGEFKGRLIENYVQQQLQSLGKSPLFYWTSPRGAEVDFLLQDEDHIIPIEVKSGISRNAKSLKVYRQNFQPKISVRASLRNLQLDEGLLNIPLYLIHELPRFLAQLR